MRIGILNYGIGNVGSIKRLCNRFEDTEVIGPNDSWSAYNLIIFPGVGSFDHAIQVANESNLRTEMPVHLSRGRFILGICVGMQILFDSSEEGKLSGLGLVGGRLKKLISHPGYPVPHMGWSCVSTTGFPFPVKGEFYFTHSYALLQKEFNNENCNILTSEYGESIVAAFNHQNIFGVQFHPEKSGTNGREFLHNIICYSAGSEQ